MPFILLILFAALFIESIGTYISVAGLGHLFNMNPIIILMAIALDIGKIAGVSFLYKYWKDTKFLMKAFMVPATAILMLITSTGVFGYLSQQFQHAIVENNQDTIQITSLEEEKTRLQARKEEIDKQIANMPADYAKARRDTMAAFAPETDRINKRLAEIDVELPQLKISNVKKSADLGPILYVAEAFNTTPEKAVKYVILTIIFVFDPLAIVLLIAGNFLIERRKPKALPPSGGIVNFTPPSVEATTKQDVDKYAEEKVEEPSVVLNPDPPEGWAERMAEEATLTTSQEEVAEEVGRDVIKLDQLQARRSALEQVDGRRADVVMSIDSRDPPPATLNKYT